MCESRDGVEWERYSGGRGISCLVIVFFLCKMNIEQTRTDHRDLEGTTFP